MSLALPEPVSPLMPSSLDGSGLDRIGRRIAALESGLAVVSPATRRLRDDLATIVRDDLQGRLYRAVDKEGVKFAPPAAATIARRGPGTVLVPHGAASRLMTGLAVTWEQAGGDWRLTARVGGAAVAWAHFHLTGTRHMPRRDFSGLSRSARDRCRSRINQYKRDLLART